MPLVVIAPAPVAALPAASSEPFDDFDLDAIIPGRRRSKPRWGLRLVLVAVLNLGLIALSGGARVPHNLDEARAMLHRATARLVAAVTHR
jgi:hypothetical protein